MGQAVTKPPSPPPSRPDNFFSKEFLTKHVSDIIAFYEPRCVDAQHGGFFQNFKVDGTVFDPSARQIVSSSRMTINFMLAGKLLGRPELVEIGRHGLSFVEGVHYVAAREAYAFTTRDREPEDMTQQCYAYAFVLAAHAAALKAGAAADGAGVRKVYELLEKKFWRAADGAYLDTISADGAVDEAYRGQNSNMHVCEALIASYEATRDTRYLRRAEVLAETFTRRLAAKGGGFVWEHYTGEWEVDWEYNKSDPTNIYRPWGYQPGHQAEWAKNLLGIRRNGGGGAWMVERAKELFDGAWDLSYDAEHGGLVYGFGPDQQWCDSEKYFWVQGESLAACAQLYKATGEAKYVERYVCLWHYCWEHWVDHEHGAWVGFKLTRDNRRLSDVKAVAGGKCDYHTLVACIEALRAFE